MPISKVIRRIGSITSLAHHLARIEVEGIDFAPFAITVGGNLYGAH